MFLPKLTLWIYYVYNLKRTENDMLNRTALVAALLILVSTAAFGQITIGTNDYRPTPGTALFFPDDLAPDETFFNSLLDGSGGPINWDFSTRQYGSGFVNYSFEPSSTPAIDSFPGANLVILTAVGVDSSWVVYNSEPSSFTRLGVVYRGSGGELVTKYTDYSTEFEFPLAYNDQWTSHRNWRQDSQDTYVVNSDTSRYVVDAWGTAIYKSNSFPCLRVVCERTLNFKTYTQHDILIGDITQNITTVFFISAGFGRMVGATRVEFLGTTTYSCDVMEEFTTITTDAKEFSDGILPTDFTLSQNYPNPFNPSTEISFSIPSRSNVRLVIHDVLGRKIATLVDRELDAGEYISRWNGRSSEGNRAASGVYFYRLTSDGYSLTRKMVLLK